MTPAIKEAFTFQAHACGSLGSPFMERMLPLLPEAVTPGTTLAKKLLSWPEDVLGPQADSVPLRMAGGLHLLHLKGAAPGLSRVYPPNSTTDTELCDALRAALRTHEASLLQTMESPPQTNEVRRASVLIAAAHWLTAALGKPLVTSEIGASAGLNLNWDFFCLRAGSLTLGPEGAPVVLSPEWRGTPPIVCPPYLAEARGVDLRPIDVSNAAEATRLQSYLWPDQADRLALTKAAIELFLAPDTEGRLEEGDALPFLRDRLAPREGHCHMIYSTIAWQYLPEAARAEGAAMIAAAGEAATDDAPLAWFRMEADGDAPGAGLSLLLWPGNREISFGRVDFHGRWVDWQALSPT